MKQLQYILIFLCLFLQAGYSCRAQNNTLYFDYPRNYSWSDSTPYYLAQGSFLWGKLNEDLKFIDRLLIVADRLERVGKIDASITWYQLTNLYTYNNKEKRLFVFQRLSHLLKLKGAYKEAFEMHYQALDLAEDRITQTILKMGISNIYRYLGNYPRVIQILDSAVASFKGDPKNLAFAYSNLSNTYGYMQDHRKALAYNKLGFEASLQIPPDQRNAEVYNQESIFLSNIAANYLELHQPDSAFIWLDQLKNYNGKQFDQPQAGTLIIWGLYYGQKKEFKKAIESINRGLARAQQSGYLYLIRSAYLSLSEMYRMQGKPEETLLNYKQFVAINDSIVSTKNIHKIQKLEIDFLTAKNNAAKAQKEMQLVIQAAALKTRNFQAALLLLVVVSLVIIIVVSVKRYFYKQKLMNEMIVNTENEKKIAQIFAGIKGEEKERVRIARELHDGVVSEVLALKLNLKAMELQFKDIKSTDNFRNALLQSEEIALKLRQTAHNLMPMQLTEQGLYSTIGAFLKRINNSHIHFTYQCYGNLPAVKEEVDKIILLMVLELIQNIMKHSRASEAMVQLSYIGHTLSITVEDNGVGISQSEALGKESIGRINPGIRIEDNSLRNGQSGIGESEGIGLNNVKENVALLTGAFDIRTSAYKGTTILIEIPMTKHLQQADTSNNAPVIEHRIPNSHVKHSDHEN